jgi:Fe-S oxidoreductase
MNPGKIVRSRAMNDRTLFRFKPDYRVPEMPMALDWSAYPGAAGGFQGAVEMCNNNGECRKHAAGVMCPSFRVTGNERDVTRGRANSLRLAISGQLGPDAFASDEMLETMKLCVSCKGCRRECPTGVDMAKMKIEVLAARNKRTPLSLHDRLVAYLPRYAPYAARLAPLMNARNWLPGIAGLTEGVTGMSARRKLPEWRGRLSDPDQPFGPADGPEVALLADTFNTYFEPGTLRDGADVLARLGYRVTIPRALEGGRPLCCGRTFLSAGLVEEARTEARRLLAVIAPLAKRGVPIVGLEPSCLLTLRDEFLAMKLGEGAAEVSKQALMFEEFLAGEAEAGRIQSPIGRATGEALLHGHCHQKSFGVMGAVTKTLGLIEGLKVEMVESSCCGMAGAFGYGADTYDTSMAMGELSLLPAVRTASAKTRVVADGFSCRHQIKDGTGRRAQHVVTVLRESLP